MLRRALLIAQLALLALPVAAGPAADRLAEADEVFRKREYAAALDVYAEAARLAEAEGDRSTQVEALSQVARMYSATERLEEGRAPLAQAGELARPEEPLGWTRYLGVRGIFERESGDETAALETFTLMHADAMRLGLPRRAIDAAHHAAIVGAPDQQIAWALKGIEAAEAAGSEGWLAVLWNNLGATYDFDLRNYSRAAECYAKARYFHHLGGDPQRMMAADWALGKAALLSGDEDRAAELLPYALAQARKQHAEAPTQSTQEWLGYTSRWQGELLVRQGRRDEGIALMREGREHLVGAGIENWWPEGLEQLDERLRELAGS